MANSPRMDAPSSMASIWRSSSWPAAASLCTTRPPSNRSRTSSTSRPLKMAGNENRTSPVVSVSIGPVKTSPSGKLRSPLQGTHVRPATPTVRSVSSASTRSVRTPDRRSAMARSFSAKSTPGRHRVGEVQPAGPVDEVLVGGQRHVGVLRERLARIGGHAPAQLLCGRAPHVQLHQRRSRLPHGGHPGRIDAGQLARVPGRVDRDPQVDRRHLRHRAWQHRRQLFLCRLRQERQLRALGGHPHPRQRAHLQRPRHHLQHQRLGQRRCLDQHQLPGLDPQRVLADHTRQALHPPVAHRNRPSRAISSPSP